MPDLFVGDAVFTGGKAAVLAGLFFFGVAQFLKADKGAAPTRLLLAGVLLALSLSPVVLLVPASWNLRHLLGSLIGYEFLLLYLFAVLAIVHVSGSTVLPRWRPTAFGFLAPAGLLVGVLLYLLPDYAGSLIYLRDLSVLTENRLGVIVSSGTTFWVVLALGMRVWKNVGKRDLGALFGGAQVLLFLAILKLLLGGTRGIAEYSLVPSMQALVMKFVHDVVHHTFTILLVPDHPLLAVTTWNFIGFFFGPNFGLLVTLVLLLLPPFFFIRKILFAPLPDAEKAASGATRRLYWFDVVRRRRKASSMAAFFVAAVLIGWFVRGGDTAVEVRVPRAKPVVADKGVVIVPLTDPTMNLRDGNLHRFALTTAEGERIAFLVVARPDDTIAVCLDACEICPPDGYGQSGDKVICLYCATPIPFGTLGKPGGCNPIPVEAEVSASDIRIPVSELEKKWRDVKTGSTREVVP